MTNLIIFPSSYNKVNETDSDYEFEKEVALGYGFSVCNFNYDEFVNGSKLKLSDRFDSNCTAIYRGWMLSPSDYLRFYNELLSYNIILLTSYDEYYNTHCFVNSYDKIAKYTPETIWFIDDINWNLVRKSFDKFIVKDFVKSVKGFDFPEYLDSSLSDNALNWFIDKFKDLRGELFTGGIILKEYVKLDKRHEFRAFYMKGEVAFIYDSVGHSDAPDLVNDLANKLCNLDSHFYTIDFAKLENGDYIVVEIGDGQVSGVPFDEIADKLYSNLKERL